MIYSDKGSLRGKWWQLGNGYWRGCNKSGQQCSFRLQVEAQRFAESLPKSRHEKVIRAVLSKKFVI